MIRRGGLLTGACLIALAMSQSLPAFAQGKPAGAKPGPDLVQQAKDAQKPENISTTLEIVLAITILSIAPALLVMTTSFTRIVIVLSFVRLAKMKKQPQTRKDIPTTVLIPAFIVSELKTAFQIGFLIFLPFLVIDLVVSSTLMSLGMVMLPPVFISLPFKILLFVLVDGWGLVTHSLVESFHS